MWLWEDHACYVAVVHGAVCNWIHLSGNIVSEYCWRWGQKLWRKNKEYCAASWQVLHLLWMTLWEHLHFLSYPHSLAAASTGPVIVLVTIALYRFISHNKITSERVYVKCTCCHQRTASVLRFTSCEHLK